MMILCALMLGVVAAWVAATHVGKSPSQHALLCAVFATVAFMCWWTPMAYLGFKDGIDAHPEFDVFVRRCALVAVLLAVSSLIFAAKNATKSLWINAARFIGSMSLLLGF